MKALIYTLQFHSPIKLLNITILQFHLRKEKFLEKLLVVLKNLFEIMIFPIINSKFLFNLYTKYLVLSQ